MTRKKHTPFSGNWFKLISLGTLCLAASFAIGIRSAGDVNPFARSEAALLQPMDGHQTAMKTGDINGDGALTVQDAIGILEVAQGYRQATKEELRRADTDADGQLTVKDALRVLHTIALL